MNTVILMGRLTRDPEVRYSQGENAMAIARYSLAVDRPKTRNNQEPGADFINCVAFGKCIGVLSIILSYCITTFISSLGNIILLRGDSRAYISVMV